MATYREAGVDIEEGSRAVQLIKKHVKSTFSKDVLLDIGAFGGAVDAKKLKKYKEPVLISSIDGVGTKTKIAAKLGKWDSVGKDIVGHSCNDILACGAEPWYFLDYLASSRLKAEKVEQIVKGMAEACKENGVSLIGGETAEMPGVYLEGETDIVGCIVGIVEKRGIIDGSRIRRGNMLIALQSNGLHTNGYSLARKVLIEDAKMDLGEVPEGFECSLGEELLWPHKSYAKAVLPLAKKGILKGIAHITGGGLIDNVGRLLPEGLGAEIIKGKLRPQPIFSLIKEKGMVPESDMFRTFNMGAGMVLIVEGKDEKKVLKEVEKAKEEAYVIGKIVKGKGVQVI
ncbi:MAG: phosphoribosylformylglycinamidine cyclo-ligase [Candidatus Diapherotrites archaeon]|uniref:Phosphoribosylformylglycinamidine cyclo-ligase n=1 Tax=Candidatus Iainarchaeum sp. TaxID=3101447 RepID=A0A938YS73_9ARCH|nr:phosphoribosylformylglycinamidine cyclo-ligase [Candidatus Diapherotrites archaeon]